MPIKRHCNVEGCNSWIRLALSDFAETEWNAFSFNNEKAKCFCPKHKKEFRESYFNTIAKKS